ncbi:MAG: oxidoreductase [bacterium]|nr:oxidoreductase [bacterium]
MSKPKAGFNWFASCGGCEEAVVDLHEAILDVVAAVDIVFWPCAMDFKKDDVRAMRDGEMDVCFINGAIRTSEEEEIAHLLRRKTKIVIAFGSCSHMGGIPGLGNLFTRDEILEHDFTQSFSVVNPEKTYPQEVTKVPEGEVELPRFLDYVRSLNQVIDVDYYLPGCPPPVALLRNAVQAVLSGELPPRGTVLAPDKALCQECPRLDSKPDDLAITEFKRPQEIIIDEEKCLLAQGLLCLGPATRSGCGAPCVNGNMPCTGCLGPTSRVKDYGLSTMTVFASLFESKDEKEIDELVDKIVDPVGSFNRYSLPSTFLHRKANV